MDTKLEWDTKSRGFLFNASEDPEIAKAAAFLRIQLFTAALKSSDTPEEELLSLEQQWAVAGP